MFLYNNSNVLHNDCWMKSPRILLFSLQKFSLSLFPCDVEYWDLEKCSIFNIQQVYIYNIYAYTYIHTYMGTEKIVMEGVWIILMLSLNKYFKKDENGFQICKRIMGHNIVFKRSFYVRAKRLITASIQSVCIFNSKTLSEKMSK